MKLTIITEMVYTLRWYQFGIENQAEWYEAIDSKYHSVKETEFSSKNSVSIYILLRRIAGGNFSAICLL